jgi:hypothetical protein|tara:strand:- start:610 stop:729 length:120 start_codon:yes stop_codon:yes gene_type:complete
VFTPSEERGAEEGEEVGTVVASDEEATERVLYEEKEERR